MSWVSVSEKLPEYLVPVEVCQWHNEKGEPKNTRKAYWLGERWGGRESPQIYGEITHWRYEKHTKDT